MPNVKKYIVGSWNIPNWLYKKFEDGSAKFIESGKGLIEVKLDFPEGKAILNDGDVLCYDNGILSVSVNKEQGEKTKLDSYNFNFMVQWLRTTKGLRQFFKNETNVKKSVNIIRTSSGLGYY